MTLGVVDVGTNSIHLMIGRVGSIGAFRVLHRQRTLVRLGDAPPASRTLPRRAAQRAMTVLRRYAETLRRYDVDRIEAVATSAVREATDGRAFVRAVRVTLSLPLRIISGREEARLTYQGVRAVEHLQGAALMVAIGGGSAQVMYGQGPAPRYLKSLPLGSARLASAFIRHDPVRPIELQAMVRHVAHAWAPIGRSIRAFHRRQALGCSAMIQQLADAAGSQTLTDPMLTVLIERLARSRAVQRLRFRGLDPQRHDFALPTAIALRAWMDTCGILRVVATRGSLREGLAAAYGRQRSRGRLG